MCFNRAVGVRIYWLNLNVASNLSEITVRDRKPRDSTTLWIIPFLSLNFA